MPTDTPKPWGPDNPHPLSQCKTELVWEGKYDEYGNRRPVRLPSFPLVMQRIETIDAPRDEAKEQPDFTAAWSDESAHRDHFRNRLIWGDNKLALAALLQEFRGRVDLIYIDPPFDVGADFTASVTLGDAGDGLAKEQSVLEAVAYRDIWGKGTDSYLHWFCATIRQLYDALSEQGSLYVHLDYHIGDYARCVVDEVFGRPRFMNEVVWKRSLPHNDPRRYGSIHDVLLVYSKTEQYTFNQLFTGLSEDYKASHYTQGIWSMARGGIRWYSRMPPGSLPRRGRRSLLPGGGSYPPG